MLSYQELIFLIIAILGLIDHFRYINKIHTWLQGLEK